MRERTALLLLLAAAACATRPSGLPTSPDLVVVKSVRLPDRDWLPWFARFAEHAFVDYCLDGQWHRVEWSRHASAVRATHIDAAAARRDERWGRPVAVLDVFDGARATGLAHRIHTTAATFPASTDYRAWPGPNSNTFIDWLARTTGLPTQLPPAAVGKDYAGWLRMGITSTGTGLEVETALLGAQLGLREGVELHVLGLTAGVGLWPPELKLPFLPGIPGGWIAP